MRDRGLDGRLTRVSEHPDENPDAAELAVAEWLTLPDLAERLGLDVLKARQVIKDRQVIGRRRGPRLVFSIPADFVQDGQVLKGLPGTIVGAARLRLRRRGLVALAVHGGRLAAGHTGDGAAREPRHRGAPAGAGVGLLSP